MCGLVWFLVLQIRLFHFCTGKSGWNLLLFFLFSSHVEDSLPDTWVETVNVWWISKSKINTVFFPFNHSWQEMLTEGLKHTFFPWKQTTRRKPPAAYACRKLLLCTWLNGGPQPFELCWGQMGTTNVTCAALQSCVFWTKQHTPSQFFSETPAVSGWTCQ